MKINTVDSASNVQVQTTAAAVAELDLRPFGGKRFLTARGTLVNPTGAGWFWLCPFGTKGQEALFEDLCGIEAAERKHAVQKATRKRA
jgi:hypothetical protein